MNPSKAKGPRENMLRGCNQREMVLESAPRLDLGRRIIDLDMLRAAGLHWCGLKGAAQASHTGSVERALDDDITVMVKRSLDFRACPFWLVLASHKTRPKTGLRYSSAWAKLHQRTAQNP
ncbi:MAG TPA: hypothetical protein VEH07_00775 [Alphaproteobacteria bacterium]|nr:hypothetical protein [Alphaproteobacteria bacterium]